MRGVSNKWQINGIAYYVLPITYHAIRNTQYPILFLLLSAALILLSACTTANAEPTSPVIHYGEDVCEFCNMIISDERYACGYITQDGQQHIFDDIGDMFQAQLANNHQVIAFFVHHHENKQWLRAEKATFVQSKSLHTPMASGIAAFDSPDRAKAFAAEVQGQVMNFSELTAYFKNNPMPMGDHGMEHGE
jgi:copper chaperone NosL